MKCHQCGFDLPDTAKFCRSCGAKQGQSLQNVTEPAAVTQPVSEILPEPSANNAFTSKAQGEISGLEASAIQQSESLRQETMAGSTPPAVENDPRLSSVQANRTDENHSPSARQKQEKPQEVESQDDSNIHSVTDGKEAIFGKNIPDTRSGPDHTKPRSKVGIYATVSVVLAVALSGVGYWGWSQKVEAEQQAAQLEKVKAEEQSARLAKQQAEEQAAQLAKQVEEQKEKEQEFLKRQKESEEIARIEAREKEKQAAERELQQKRQLAEEKIRADAAQKALQKQAAEKEVQKTRQLAEDKARADADQKALQSSKTEQKNAETKAVSTQKLDSGTVFRDCENCPEMVVLPRGEFNMGSPSSEVGRDNQETQRHVVIEKSFAIAKTEITRGQFEYFVKETTYAAANECWIFSSGKWEKSLESNWRNPGYPQESNHPVACISWNDAKAYTDWLSRKTGKAYRLPTEAEWEYAARAGTTTSRYWGEDPSQSCSYANLGDKSAKDKVPGWIALYKQEHACLDNYAYTAPVGSYKPNRFGLYDMLGNVLEWTEECNSGDCKKRGIRGGAWSNNAQPARSANRRWEGVTAHSSIFGFRPVRVIQ